MRMLTLMLPFEFVFINCTSYCLRECVDSSNVFPGFLSHCFLKNIISVLSVWISICCDGIDRNKRKKKAKRRNKSFRKEFFFPFVPFLFFCKIERMNTKTTYFKILNTNCAERRRWSIMIVFAKRRDATCVSSHSISSSLLVQYFFHSFSFLFFLFENDFFSSMSSFNVPRETLVALYCSALRRNLFDVSSQRDNDISPTELAE